MSELRRQRLAKGWTQKQLACAMNTSIAAVSEWERGQRQPHPKRFPKLAKLFGIEALALTRVIEPSNQ